MNQIALYKFNVILKNADHTHSKLSKNNLDHKHKYVKKLYLTH